MTKLLPSLALALVASVGVGAAAPAFAAPQSLTSGATFGGFDESYELTRLNDQGVNAVDVSEDGNRLRATVKLDDGSTAFEYYDADTLQKIGGSTSEVTGSIRRAGNATVQHSKPSVSVDSLTRNTWGD